MPGRMLEGQVALVTGAGRGLGRAFAERLAALGCHIAVHGMREEGPSEYGGTRDPDRRCPLPSPRRTACAR